MYNRWFLFIVVALTLTGLSLAIYFDAHWTLSENGTDSLHAHKALTSSSDYVESEEHSELLDLSEADQERISLIHSVLDTLTDTRARLPYYGELILVHSRAGEYNKAAFWAEKRAVQTEQFSDFIYAASLYFSVTQQEKDESYAKESAYKAKEMYINALDLKPNDPDVLTDLAVVYMSLLQPDSSYAKLEMAREVDPDHIRAHFNTGVLLHQLGNIRESIPFLERSLVLAENSDWEVIVQEYLDHHLHEIYH